VKCIFSGILFHALLAGIAMKQRVPVQEAEEILLKARPTFEKSPACRILRMLGMAIEEIPYILLILQIPLAPVQRMNCQNALLLQLLTFSGYLNFKNN